MESKAQNKKDYLERLARIYKRIPNEFEKEIFLQIYNKYKKSLMGKSSKYTTKIEIVKNLVDKGLLDMKVNRLTGLEELPTDRTVRRAVRVLVKNGIPILSSSRKCGYYICDNTKEVIQPLNENKKRALSILAKQKGYEKMQMFVAGQIDITDINTTDKDCKNATLNYTITQNTKGEIKECLN